MIPLKLNIKNFVSYGLAQESIDFSPHNLICLSGKNGHGKSALLDAITWVIWGQARKSSGSSKAEEGLLRLGQSHMMVTLDISSNNLNYRIKREYRLSGLKGQTNLEFGIVNSDESIKPLTEKTIRATQKKIELTIGIDYDSFVNSAFIRQGLSNEFSKKSPKERKDILASILGLNKYDSIKTLASEKVKLFSQEKKHIESSQEIIKEELKQKIELFDKLEILNKNLNKIQTKEQELKNNFENIKLKQKDFNNKKEEFEKLKYQKSQIREKLEESKLLFISQVNSFRNTLKINRSLGNYKELELKKFELENKIEDLQKIAQQKIELKDNYFSVKEKENNQKQKLEQEFNKNIEEFNAKAQELKSNKNNLKQRLEEISNNLIKYNQEQSFIEKKLINTESFIKNNLISNLDQEEKQFDKRKTYYNKYLTRIDFISNELKNIAQKELLIKDNKKPLCPLCEQDLTYNHKHNLSNNIEKEKIFLNYRLNKLNNIIKNLKNILTEQYNNLKNLKVKQEKVNTAQIQKDQIVLDLSKIKELIKEFINKDLEYKKLLKNNIQDLSSLEQVIIEFKQKALMNIEQDFEYKSYKEERLKIEHKLKNLEFDQELYNKLIKARELLIQKHSDFKVLEKELAFQEQRKISIHSEGKKIKKLKLEVIAIELSLDKFKSLNNLEQSILYQEQELIKEQNNLVKEKEYLLQQKGALEEQKKLLEKKEKEIKELQIKLREIDQEKDDYQDIAQALSKDGIQALLIEESLPEIEQEANSILARLTNNQAHLIIDSLKDLKSGKTKETLDIKISDSMGIRAYELFSGGEAFRIDFALRIAISKLLARRSGTALQTLIIDEGFGSQDEEGLNYIMESIYKVQDDFAKVIIVSHLPMLKEQFPVHFAITKTPQGSIIKVIENG